VTGLDAPHVLTVDLEDWFHSLDPDPAHWSRYDRRAGTATRSLLKILDRRMAKATFFVLGDVALHDPELIRELAAQGHEIGSHGMKHRFICRQTASEFRQDLRESIELLESIVGTRVQAYRAPYFSITNESTWALDILRDEGIRCDSSIFPVHNYRYGIPGACRTPNEIVPGLWEWPPSTLPVGLVNFPIAGGFYLRLLPSLAVERSIRALERRHEAVVLYVHPWEIDPDQPRLDCPFRFTFIRHYHALSRTQGKLDRVLRLGRFTTLSNAMPAPKRESKDAAGPRAGIDD
jgi:polysaccharide deacetylase family protein (PEP-CTERM system associated)